MRNTAVIKRIIKFSNFYHAIAQDKNGFLYHKKFNSELEAREFLILLISQTKIKYEELV